MSIRIKGWEDFQHYSDRNPPWIKLHKSILEKRAINMLSDRSYRILTGLWLLASEDEKLAGELPPLSDIAYRLRFSEDEVTKAIQELREFLIVDDINVLADASKEISGGYPSHAQVKRETEGETETEAEKRQSKNIVSKPENVSAQTWKDFLAHRKVKKSNLTQTAMTAIVKQAGIAGWSLEDALQEVCSRGWVSFKAEWVANKQKPTMRITGQENYNDTRGTEGFIVE